MNHPTKQFIVITTIRKSTPALEALRNLPDWHVVIVGDRKTPPIPSSDRCTYLDIDNQQRLSYEVLANTPFNHYSRKNIGYLYAISKGASLIYDVDDDTIPYPGWKPAPFRCQTQLTAGRPFVNAYRHFTDALIWPRGFPLDEIRASFLEKPVTTTTGVSAEIGAWSGLVDGDPDVDAIYRLTVGGDIRFEQRDPVFLSEGSWCPFNSQNTFWQPAAFHALYLPVSVNFRFTDILRSYVAQRLFQEQSLRLGFLAPIVYQDRNPHDLMHDFADEEPCYRQVKQLVTTLEKTTLEPGRNPENLVRLYEALCRERIVSESEVRGARSWIRDIAH